MKLKIMSVITECLEAGIPSLRFSFFLCLFKRVLNVASHFPTYWSLHNVHSNKQIKQMFLQMILHLTLILLKI